MPRVAQETTNQASTASYVTLLKARLVSMTHCTITLTNSHGSNGIKFKILVSNDPHGADGTWAEEKAETVLAAAAAKSHAISAPFAWVDVQIIDENAGNHGIGNAWLQACGL